MKNSSEALVHSTAKSFLLKPALFCLPQHRRGALLFELGCPIASDMYYVHIFRLLTSLHAPQRRRRRAATSLMCISRYTLYI
eukprot:6189690-Pleurochrysis_carterae.AAC.1